MCCFIDDEFIEKWRKQYSEGDEPEYERLVKEIASQIRESGTLTPSLLEAIYNWKSPRAKGRVHWDRFSKYENAFKIALRLEPNEDRADAVVEIAKDAKVETLDDLPGIGVPVASTILHMRYPSIFPIVDVRTVEVFQKCGCLDSSKKFKSYSETINGYREFRGVFFLHLSKCKKTWTLREFDKALFAYHKKNNPSLPGHSCTFKRNQTSYQ